MAEQKGEWLPASQAWERSADRESDDYSAAGNFVSAAASSHVGGDDVRRTHLLERAGEDLNRFVRGWAGYFRYGNSTVQFDQIVKHADRRLALLLAHRYQRAWWYGRKLLNSRPDRYGLTSLNGIIVAPRPNRGGARGDQRQSAMPRDARRLSPTRPTSQVDAAHKLRRHRR